MAPKRSAKTPSTPSKRSHPSSTKTTPRKKPKIKTKPSIRSQRSIWNSKDDWDTLVSESTLSTSSISTRQPRLRELPSLVKCTTDSISRGFKRLWETGGSGEDIGKEFKIAWGYLPNHLKEGIRDQIFKWWGGFLTVKIISEVFLIPPHLYLPGEILPSIFTAEYIKTLIPPVNQKELFTSLTLKHASKASDLGISALIYNLPNLDSINLKGCSLVGDKTISEILKRVTSARKINLKGTKVTEKDVKDLLEKFGDLLEVFKVDDILFENINDTFSSSPFPKLTKLCLPGYILNSPSKDFRNRAKILGHTIGYPQPRQTNEESKIQWYSFNLTFPNLTHLYLPNLLIPEDTTITLNPGLVKLVLGPSGPPVPVDTLIRLLENQVDSLKVLHLGHLKSKLTSSNAIDSTSFQKLGEFLNRCENLEECKLQTDPAGSKDSVCDSGMSRYSNLIYGPGLSKNWRNSLKKLSLSIPQVIESTLFFPSFGITPEEEEVGSFSNPLEQLELPSANIDNTEIFATALKGLPKLRLLDLSGTTITDDDMKIILNACPSLSRIDLTSCRGINVRHRRNIFKALQDE